MSFTSLLFITCFLPSALILYYLCSFSRKLQNFILLVLSLGFYALGQGGYIFILAFSILWNWIIGLLIDSPGHPGWKKVFMVTGILINALVLIFFRQLVPLGGILFNPQLLPRIFSFALPLGLSYYTFQAIGYCADIYRGEIRAEKNPAVLGLYLSFFPKMIAGPINSFGDMKSQFMKRTFSVRTFSAGLCRFGLGLSKNVLLAGHLLFISDYVFRWSAMGDANVPALLAWLGLLAYTLGIYTLFSGCIDMAIGLGGMFGFVLPEIGRAHV
jgi:D-alanyl-lipoteichoic acid acyltransferase DltB (MBOAT superfamily)